MFIHCIVVVHYFSNILLQNIILFVYVNQVFFIFSIQNCSELKKLSEESLARPPEEVFDIICKLGEGSYGSVYKALHKESGVVCIIMDFIIKLPVTDKIHPTKKQLFAGRCH